MRILLAYLLMDTLCCECLHFGCSRASKLSRESKFARVQATELSSEEKPKISMKEQLVAQAIPLWFAQAWHMVSRLVGNDACLYVHKIASRLRLRTDEVEPTRVLKLVPKLACRRAVRAFTQ